MSDYANKPKATGNIFKNGYKNKQTHPDYKSTITIPAELLRDMVEFIKQDTRREKGVDLSIAMWDRVSKNPNPKTGDHTPYLYTVIEIDNYKSDKEKAQQEATDSVNAEASVKTDSFDDEDVPF
jgi:hypothetical protein|tara:strand:- start:1323 stop:1694 length:372 start_codon:yes stop_codon:yes gene_type:complete